MKEKKYENTKQYRELKAALFKSLEERGLVDKVYTDMAESYLDLWVQKRRLNDDVRERGVSVMDAKRGMPVENRSVSLGVQVNKEMLNIYAALGFKDISCGKALEPFDDEL